MMDELDDFFGNDELDREPSPMGEEAIEDNSGDVEGKKVIKPKLTTRKIMTNRLALNERTLTGPKGIPALRDTFKDFKPNPKDDPYKNLEKLMKKYAYWSHLMFPKMKTEDVLNRVENLGTRRQVKVYLMKQRLGENVDAFENERENKTDRNAIIDDGADDDEERDDMFGDPPQNEIPPASANIVKAADSRTNKNTSCNNDEIGKSADEEYLMMKEEELQQLREEQEAIDAAAEDELMEDFDLNNDW